MLFLPFTSFPKSKKSSSEFFLLIKTGNQCRSSGKVKRHNENFQKAGVLVIVYSHVLSPSKLVVTSGKVGHSFMVLGFGGS